MFNSVADIVFMLSFIHFHLLNSVSLYLFVNPFRFYILLVCSLQSTPVGTTIFRHIQALDKDAGVNGLVEYFIVEGNTNTTEDEKMTIADGYGIFVISFPHQGQVTIAKTLDYEKVQRYYLTIVAS
ncbi:PREDICTED: protocadherin Fat 4-like, partial [Rhagoletis zephyria]